MADDDMKSRQEGMASIYSGDTTQIYPTIATAIDRLPQYFYNKSMEIVDKLALTAVYCSFSMAQGMSCTFNSKVKTSAPDVKISLKNSRAFKDWHRGLEDVIDDSLNRLKAHLAQFSDVVRESTGNTKLADYLKVVQSFEYFQDRSNVADRAEGFNLTSWGLKEMSYLLGRSEPVESSVNDHGARQSNLVDNSVASYRERQFGRKSEGLGGGLNKHSMLRQSKHDSQACSRLPTIKQSRASSTRSLDRHRPATASKDSQQAKISQASSNRSNRDARLSIRSISRDKILVKDIDAHDNGKMQSVNDVKPMEEMKKVNGIAARGEGSEVVIKSQRNDIERENPGSKKQPVSKPVVISKKNSSRLNVAEIRDDINVEGNGGHREFEIFTKGDAIQPQVKSSAKDSKSESTRKLPAQFEEDLKHNASIMPEPIPDKQEQAVQAPIKPSRNHIKLLDSDIVGKSCLTSTELDQSALISPMKVESAIKRVKSESNHVVDANRIDIAEKISAPVIEQQNKDIEADINNQKNRVAYLNPDILLQSHKDKRSDN